MTTPLSIGGVFSYLEYIPQTTAAHTTHRTHTMLTFDFVATRNTGASIIWERGTVYASNHTHASNQVYAKWNDIVDFTIVERK